MSKLLSPQVAKFIKAKLSGQNSTQAAIAAGYAPSSAKQRGYELMKRPEVREALGITLDKLGIDFTKAVAPIAAALEATKTVAHKRWVKGENGDLYEDMFVETEPDHATRLKAAGMALKLIADENTLNTSNTNVAQYSGTDQQALHAKLADMDEVELQRAIFRKVEE